MPRFPSGHLSPVREVAFLILLCLTVPSPSERSIYSRGDCNVASSNMSAAALQRVKRLGRFASRSDGDSPSSAHVHPPAGKFSAHSMKPCDLLVTPAFHSVSYGRLTRNEKFTGQEFCFLFLLRIKAASSFVGAQNTYEIVFQQIMGNFVGDRCPPPRRWVSVIVEDGKAVATLDECTGQGPAQREIKVVSRRSFQ